MSKHVALEAGHFIGGRSCLGSGSERIPVVDPATRDVVGGIVRGTPDDVDEAVACARETVRSRVWSRQTPHTRAKVLQAAADLLRARSEEIATLEMVDVGKPISQARREVESAARSFEFAASAIDKVMGNTIPVESGAIDFTIREPWGVSAQIVPWNYPLTLAVRGIAPALAMGNSVVLKPAEDASLSCLRLAELLVEAGLPAGVLNVVTGLGHEVGAALAGHEGIDHVTFTGSVATGCTVMQLAARNIVPVVLELGGKSPQIVFADANLERAVPAIVRSLISNAGQTCVAGTRLLVESSAHDVVLDAITDALGRVRVGLPSEDPDLGPLISERQQRRVLEYVDLGRAEGLDLVIGGDEVSDPRLTGYYVEPTVFDGTPRSSRLFQEEIFGPVLCVTEFSEMEEAAALANDSEYGLMASIWTASLTKALSLATTLETGQVFVNTGGLTEGTAVPFGGSKRSGFGRDKGMEGMVAYSQLKNVAIRFD